MTISRTRGPTRTGVPDAPADEDPLTPRAQPGAVDAFEATSRTVFAAFDPVVNGVAIVSHGCSAKALAEAQSVTSLLTQRPDIAKALADKKVTLVIIPVGVRMTDLPEFAELRGKKTFDGRLWDDVRGSGGLTARGRTVVGVAEENLADLPSNTYPKGYSIAMHELAHAIQNHALPRDEQKRIAAAFDAREAAKGPWTERYGASNEQEYFAQLTNAWFGRNAGLGHNGADWVRENDPVMAAELQRIYRSDGVSPPKPTS